MAGLRSALEALPDRRTRKGRRYSLSSIVLLSQAAMLAGANDLLAIHRFGRRLSVKSLEALGMTRARPPAHATLHYVFRQIAADDLERALRGLVTASDGLGHVAIDGKRLRGNQHLDSPGVHMLQAFSVKLKAVVGALVVPPDSGEMVEALKLIADLPLGPGDVVTGDAAFTYEPVAREIRRRGPSISYSSKPIRPVCKLNSPTPSATIPPLKGGSCSGPAGSA